MYNISGILPKGTYVFIFNFFKCCLALFYTLNGFASVKKKCYILKNWITFM